ncbi:MULTISPECIES: hypothetical protein [unclassified Francisella]|uniref:hypothetical protein n=1 Tax=unclassified Francisella TaxID=2610885 RepID=UPI002E330627|nr:MULTISPECIES: hypothetical protein [unclassified Francisella]MED7819070.1 hypothetical protein [Francisella sp. 19S2-4]MED7829907.1 hypothetical protein [Francisella sp. 19S2-10]
MKKNQKKEAPPLEFLPNDNRYRFIWTIEGLLKGVSSEPDVMMVFRYFYNGRPFGFEWYPVPYKYACICKAGQVYKGQKLVDRPYPNEVDDVEILSFYDGETYYIEQETAFKVSYNNPVRHYSTNLPESKKYILPLEMLRPSVRKWTSLNKSPQTNQITELVCDEGNILYVPTFEIFQKMLVPQSKEIQRKLLISHLDEILKDYLVLENCSKIDGDKCKIQFKKDYENISKTSKHFIACLYVDEQTRKIASGIWSYMQNNYDRNTPIMPAAEPYTDMDITARGIWLKDNVFLVLNITGLHFGQKVELEELIDEYSNNSSGDTRKSHNRKKSIHENDLPYDNYNDPGANAGLKKIKSNVDVGINMGITNSSIQKESEGSVDKEFIDEDETLAVSFGDESNACQSKNIAKCIDYEIEKNNMEGSLFLIYETLIRLQKASYISEVCCLTHDFKDVHSYHLNTFPRELLPKRKNSWLLKDNGDLRNYLLVKITLDNGRKLILFELEKRTSSEAFCGILFNNPHSFFRRLDILLRFIVENRGKLTEKANGKLIDKDLPVDNNQVFSHKYSSNRLANTFISLLEPYQSD